MGTNEEILTAMIAGESVDNINPVGVNGKILKAKAQGESVDNFQPVGNLGKLLKGENVNPVGINGKILQAKNNGESVEGFSPIGKLGELLKEADFNGGGTCADEVYKYYDVNREEYPYFVFHIPISSSWSNTDVYFFKTITLSSGNGFMRIASADAIQIHNTTKIVDAFTEQNKAIEYMKEKLPNTITKSYISTSASFRNSYFVIATNIYECMTAILGTSNFINMDVPVE